jgi:hypothetical protein
MLPAMPTFGRGCAHVAGGGSSGHLARAISRLPKKSGYTLDGGVGGGNMGNGGPIDISRVGRC